jgi:hypothetical protein
MSQREVDALSEIAKAEATAIARLHLTVATFVRRAMRNFARVRSSKILSPSRRMRHVPQA